MGGNKGACWTSRCATCADINVVSDALGNSVATRYNLTPLPQTLPEPASAPPPRAGFWSGLTSWWSAPQPRTPVTEEVLVHDGLENLLGYVERFSIVLSKYDILLKNVNDAHNLVEAKQKEYLAASDSNKLKGSALNALQDAQKAAEDSYRHGREVATRIAYHVVKQGELFHALKARRMADMLLSYSERCSEFANTQQNEWKSTAATAREILTRT